MAFKIAHNEITKELFDSVASYLDETYTQCQVQDSTVLESVPYVRVAEISSPEPGLMLSCDSEELESFLSNLDAGFSETLLSLIDKTGKKDSDIYKKANIDRKLFSKIRSNPDYRPSKATALAFAIALELDIEETHDFIARAGYALSHSNKFDIIVEYFILQKIYDINQLNHMLFAFDQPLLGS